MIFFIQDLNKKTKYAKHIKDITKKGSSEYGVFFCLEYKGLTRLD